MMTFKRTMSFLMALVLFCGMLPPVQVRAEETEPTAVEETTAAETVQTSLPVQTETSACATEAAETEPVMAEETASRNAAAQASSAETISAGVVTDELGVYSSPGGSGALLYTMPEGTEVVVVRQETVMDVAWGYITSPYAGWIRMEGVQVPEEYPQETTVPTENTEPVPTETAPEPTEATTPAENVPEATGICGDDLPWAYDADTTTLTISGSGPMWDYADGAVPEWLDFLEIATVVLEEGVTGIGDYAFVSCYGLTNVVIPDGVESIGNYAFFWCEDLLSLELPKTVTRVGESAFACCNALTTVTLPDSLTDLGEAVFSCCGGLQKIVLPKNAENFLNTETEYLRYTFDWDDGVILEDEKV